MKIKVNGFEIDVQENDKIFVRVDLGRKEVLQYRNGKQLRLITDFWRFKTINNFGYLIIDTLGILGIKIQNTLM
jgi:hypothetical protein